MEIRKPYDDSPNTSIDCSEPVVTEQAPKEAVDVNTIWKKYQKTGTIDHVRSHAGTYMDAPSGKDFQSAMNLIAQATTVFEELPSSVRASFDNDPVKYLDAIENKTEEAIELGLVARIDPVETAQIELPLSDGADEAENGSQEERGE